MMCESRGSGCNLGCLTAKYLQNRILQNRVSERRLGLGFRVAKKTRTEPTFATDMKIERITCISIKFSASYMLLVAFCLLYSSKMRWKLLGLSPSLNYSVLLSDTGFWSIYFIHHPTVCECGISADLYGSFTTDSSTSRQSLVTERNWVVSIGSDITTFRPNWHWSAKLLGTVHLYWKMKTSFNSPSVSLFDRM